MNACAKTKELSKWKDQLKEKFFLSSICSLGVQKSICIFTDIDENNNNLPNKNKEMMNKNKIKIITTRKWCNECASCGFISWCTNHSSCALLLLFLSVFGLSKCVNCGLMLHYIISPTLSDCIQTLKKHMINKGNKVFRHNFRKKKFINWHFGIIIHISMGNRKWKKKLNNKRTNEMRTKNKELPKSL